MLLAAGDCCVGVVVSEWWGAPGSSLSVRAVLYGPLAWLFRLLGWGRGEGCRVFSPSPDCVACHHSVL